MFDVLIACAGLGSRFLSHHHNFPKGLAPVGGKPLLGHLLDQLQTVPLVNNIFVSAYSGLDLFDSYIDTHELRKKTRLIFDPSLSGFKYLIDLDLVKTNQVVVMHGDNFYDGSLSPFFSSFSRSSRSMALTFRSDQSKNFGVFLEERDRSITFHEKVPGLPANDSFAAVLGLSASQLIKLAEEHSNVFISECLVPNLLKDLDIYRFEGVVFDLGSPESYVECNRIFSESVQDDISLADARWMSKYRNHLSVLEECLIENSQK